MITKNELVAIINTAFDAVSSFSLEIGPALLWFTGLRELNNPGYMTFLNVVQKLVPCVMDANFSGETVERKADGTTVRTTISQMTAEASV